ncbi:GNAT family N-acetyltransferase [Exiguobacterium sp. s39]|uniref:GNAT family N-acetyltransferase n=1 Tax=Exiguobacterium sp. s39 TaxID=2751198 RepID=UPI001BE93D1E|nr:GNAT family N-acetyltransferase [Exiguobacterium sp. s39]
MIIDTLSNHPEQLEVVATMIHTEFVQKKKGTAPYEKVKAFLDKKTSEPYPMTFVALDDVTCIGTVSLFENDLNERLAYTPWLASLFVEKVYRNQGIAQQLINQLIVYAKSRQITTIYLKTENASAYYIKLGWTLVETIETTDPPIHIFSYTIDEN